MQNIEVGTHYGNLTELESWTEGEKSLDSILSKIAKEWKKSGYNLKNMQDAA